MTAVTISCMLVMQRHLVMFYFCVNACVLAKEVAHKKKCFLAWKWRFYFQCFSVVLISKWQNDTRCQRAEPTVLYKQENGRFCIWIHAILQRIIYENCFELRSRLQWDNWSRLLICQTQGNLYLWRCIYLKNVSRTAFREQYCCSSSISTNNDKPSTISPKIGVEIKFG